MVEEGALAHLSRQRIWQEMEKALGCRGFYLFVRTARECGALSVLLPEIGELWNVPERRDYHPEGNSGEHTVLSLKAADTDDAMVNLAVLLHDVGKRLRIRKNGRRIADMTCWEQRLSAG